MQNSESITSDEDINLYRYYQLVAKRKWLLFGIFLSVILITAIVNFSFPKIYKAEVVFKLVTPEFAEVLEMLNTNEQKNLKNIFPANYNVVDEVHAGRFIDELHPSLDSASKRIKVSVDVTDTSKISSIISELNESIINFPVYKKSIDKLKELWKKELEEINKSIAVFEGNSVNKEFQISDGNNLVQLKSRKVFLEQSLKNNLTTEITYQYVLTDPVKPQIKRNICLAGIISFLSTVIAIIIGTWARKFNSPAAAINGK